jgi:hypothetical protein
MGASSVSRPVLVEVLPDGATPPSGAGLNAAGAWTAVNIGDASTSGGLSAGATTMSLTGSGRGFEEVSDSIRFVWKPLTGDGSITGRVSGFSANNDGKAYGGLMMRSSLRRESSNVAATVISGGGVRFTSRTENGAYTEPDAPHLAGALLAPRRSRRQHLHRIPQPGRRELDPAGKPGEHQHVLLRPLGSRRHLARHQLGLTDEFHECHPRTVSRPGSSGKLMVRR